MSPSSTESHSQRVLYLAPTGTSVGLTSVSMGLVRALDRMGIKVAFFKPIAQLFRGDTGPERSTHVIRNITDLQPPEPIPYPEAEKLFTSGNSEQLLENLVERFHLAAADTDVVVVEGLINTDVTEHAAAMNLAISRTLDASVILVAAPVHDNLRQLDIDLRNTAQEFGGVDTNRTLGAIINFVNAPRDNDGRLRPDLELEANTSPLTSGRILQECTVFHDPEFRLLACVPWLRSMAVSRTFDVAQHLRATVINEGDIRSRRVHHIYLCARTVDHITFVFKANALLVIPVDRMDLFIAACMAAINGVPLAGVVLTSAGEPEPGVLKLCQRALDTGLPVLSVKTDSYATATLIPRMNTEVSLDDRERFEMGMNHVASQIDPDWVNALTEFKHQPRMSPAAFRYRLVQFARHAQKRIVLPEGDEPRTIEAAATCQRRGIAQCVLLGEPAKILANAEKIGVELPDTLELVDPRMVRTRYIVPFVELRKHKGVDRKMAAMQLEDNVMLGTMMLHLGEVDGLVSGAVHTTADTVRPALQLIKCQPGNRFVSSVFFMLLPEQVVIYGDCAILENPDAQTLAEVAIQSAESAKAFGIPPRIAMISYSTGDSGQGSDVQKVKEATRIARELRPDLLIDGPLQYDAASTASVARTKAPNSPVAGQATVFIFPDLNTGNTTYKAVQRSANVVSIGPMLQGLNKPVNDLSRGALVEDIVYTIALTAIQAN